MAGERLFDIGRVDVVPAPDDEVLRAARDPEVAVLVDPAEIARAQVDVVVEEVQVLVALGVGRAREYARVRHADLAHLVRPHLGHAAVGGVDQDLHVGVGERDADRPDPLLPLDRVAGDEAGGLRQPVAFDDVDAGGLLEPAEELDGKRRGAGERGLHAGDVGIHRALHQGGDRGGHDDDEADLPAFDKLPEVVEDAFAPVARRGREDDVGAGGDHRHEDHVAGEDVEERQRADDVVFGLEQELRPDPAVVDHARIPVLGDLRHPRGAAGVEVGGDAIALRVREGERSVFCFASSVVKSSTRALWVGCTFGPDEGHDPRLRRREVAVEVHLDHRLDVGGERHGGMRLLRHVGLGEALERDDDLGLRLAQDRADLVDVEERVDRVRDPCDGRADQRDRGLVAVGQDVGDHVAFADPEAAEEVRGLRGLRVELGPGQRLGLVLRART